MASKRQLNNQTVEQTLELQKKKQLIKENLRSILQEIKEKVLSKYGLEGMKVSEIAFDEGDRCEDGSEPVCRSYGINPRTGRPIIRCRCGR